MTTSVAEVGPAGKDSRTAAYICVMRACLRACVASMLLTTVAWFATARPARAQGITLRILVTDDAHVSPRVMEAAKQIVERLYRDADIGIEWIDYLAPELPLVVSIAPPGGAERLGVGTGAMGYTFRTQEPGPGGRALIFPDRVARRADLARVDPSRLLGAVIAHEIGHMLLADAHAPTGLMRGRWNDRDLRLIDMNGLCFNAGERLRLQQELLRRFSTE
jgi:hypothetical protein